MDPTPDTRPLAGLNPLDDMPTYFHTEELARLIAQLPSREQNSREWRALLLIFLNVPRLWKTRSKYLNLSGGQVDILAFNGAARLGLAYTERFFADLAFHLYNGTPLPNGLIPLRYMDSRNFELALAAIRVAYA